MLLMLKWLCEQLMGVEVTAKINASNLNVIPKNWSIVLVIELDDSILTWEPCLFVPKLRKGGYVLFFVIEKTRSEVALMNVIQEAYINGVSTHKVEKLAKSLDIASISR